MKKGENGSVGLLRLLDSLGFHRSFGEWRLRRFLFLFSFRCILRFACVCFLFFDLLFSSCCLRLLLW
jgi:hypothetical protein